MGHTESNRAAAGKAPRGAHGGNGPPASLRAMVRATFATAPASRAWRASGSQALRPRSHRRRRARSNPAACRDRVRFRKGRHQSSGECGSATEGNADQFSHIGAPRASPDAADSTVCLVRERFAECAAKRRRARSASCPGVAAPGGVSRARRGSPLGAGGCLWYPRSGPIPGVLVRKISTTPTPARDWWMSFRVGRCLSDPTN